jgi:DNA-binding transcriptional ArsR family regulator
MSNVLAGQTVSRQRCWRGIFEGGYNARIRLHRLAQLKAMKDPLQPSHCARQLSALAAPDRLKIIRFLRDGPRNVTAIAEMLNTTLVNVSHHINVLRQARILRGRKRGRFVYYSLVPGVLQTVGEGNAEVEYLHLGCCRLEIPCDSGGERDGR